MTKLGTLLLSFVAVSASWAAAPEPTSTGPAATATATPEKPPAEIHVPRITGPITIDGKLDEADWAKAPRVSLRKMDGSEATRHTEVRLLHDDDRVYFGFFVEDPDIWTDHDTRDSRMWTEDVVEVFIDVDPSDPYYAEIEVNPKGTLFDVFLFEHRGRCLKAWDPPIEVAVQVDGTVNQRDDKDRSWTVEMSVPARDMAPMPLLKDPPPVLTPGTAWRMELCRNDSSKGLDRELTSWTPVPNDFHAVSAYGRVVFD
jgi:hypothetical protein